MKRSLLRLAVAAVGLALALSPPAQAGQINIQVGGAMNAFSPLAATANFGDNIIWIWAGGGHTVTSGVAATQTYDGRFRSTTNPLGNVGKQFSWRATIGTGTVAYFCFPHAPGMAATVFITPAGTTPVADMRITEVEFAGNGGLDRVQVSNLGGASGSLSAYRLSSQSSVSTTLTTNAITLAANARVTLHLAASGTNTATDVFVPAAAALASAGSFALYVPNNTTAGEGSTIPASLTDANQIVDYVEWGAIGQLAQPNQTTASSRGVWTAGDVVEVANSLPNGGAGYSLSFCGTPSDHGASFWQISTPNFGTGAVCSTPARNPTWGRIKALYR